MTAAASSPAPEHKPLLRGWLHAGGALVAAAATSWLLAQGDPERAGVVGLFGCVTVLLYAVSAAYHIGEWRQPVKRLLAKLDYANIALYIAATHTVLCLRALPPEHCLPVLARIWVLGAAATAVVLVLPARRRQARTLLYLVTAWAGLVWAPALQPGLAPQALIVLLVSALAYLVGGAIYALRRPDPLPEVFGFHELFHLLTIVANTALAVAIWIGFPAGAPAGA
jgi:hemolysin III